MNTKKICLSTFALIIALSSIQVTEAKMTKEAHALYQQACNLEYKNDYISAINTIQKAIEINGEDAMLYTKIAGLYSDVGRYTDSINAYKKAVKLRPNDAFIYISMGNILQTMGDYENAYNSFKHAQQIYPEYKYNYLNLANIEYFRKNYDSAIQHYNTFLSAYPEHQEASENLANVYYSSNKPEKACAVFNTIYKKYPTAFKDYVNYGMALFDTKQFQPASEMLSKALEDNPEDEVLLVKLALSYQHLEDNDKALDTFEKIFTLNPKLVALKFDYANLLGNIGRYDEAVENYKEYLKSFPNDADAYRNLGLVYKKMENDELALFNLEKSYSKDSSNIETKKELAFAYHQKLDYVNALKFYNLALKGEPENYELLANKALTLHAMNNYVASIELYKNLLEKQYNDRLEQNLTSASIAYGYDLLNKKDYGEAILYFEDATKLNQNEASAFYGLALANDKMGCKDIALTNYEKAVLLAPANREFNIALKDFKNALKPKEVIIIPDLTAQKTDSINSEKNKTVETNVENNNPETKIIEQSDEKITNVENNNPENKVVEQSDEKVTNVENNKPENKVVEQSNKKVTNVENNKTENNVVEQTDENVTDVENNKTEKKVVEQTDEKVTNIENNKPENKVVEQRDEKVTNVENNKQESDVVEKNTEEQVNIKKTTSTQDSEVIENENELASSYEGLIKLGDIAYEKQNYEKAIDYYTKAIIFIPQDKITMVKIANIYKLIGNNAKAISFYDKILIVDPKNIDAYFNKGLVYATQKNYEKSIESFQKVIELSPKYSYAYYSLGLAYEHQKDIDKALEYYKKYSELETDENMLDIVNDKIKQLEK